MSILALDPSLSATGVALLHIADFAPKWDVGTIKCVKSMAPGDRAEYKRITDITTMTGTWIDMMCEGVRPELSVIEAPAFSKNGGMAHERAGLWWHLYGMLVNVGAPILVILPNLRAKYATGKGTAGKDEVMLAAARRYPEASITNNNEADAVVLAAMGARFIGQKIDGLPGTHIAAMKTLTT